MVWNRRQVEHIKARGRWGGGTSVRRYAKQGKVQGLVSSLQPEIRAFTKWATVHIDAVLCGSYDPRPAPCKRG